MSIFNTVIYFHVIKERLTSNVCISYIYGLQVYNSLGRAAVSMAARRLSACLSQEVLVRRYSPTSHDLASQISQLDIICREGNGSTVKQETSTSPLGRQNLGNFGGRRLSLDVTRLSAQVPNADGRRGSLRYSYPSTHSFVAQVMWCCY